MTQDAPADGVDLVRVEDPALDEELADGPLQPELLAEHGEELERGEEALAHRPLAEGDPARGRLAPPLEELRDVLGVEEAELDGDPPDGRALRALHAIASTRSLQPARPE